MPTIKDVALHAGVSRSTVSRVMNNHPYVDEEKRRAVRVAMTELGYIPNSSAQRLRGTETRTIAVLVSRIVNPFFSAIVDAMDEIAAAHSYRLILCNTRGSASQELHFLQLLRTKQVDGIILASIVNEWAIISPFTEYGPIVLCNEYPSHAEGVAIITIDQKQAMVDATTHLIEKGYKRIAYCNVHDERSQTLFDSALATDRYSGYVETMKKAELPIESSWRFIGHSVEDGKRILNEIMKCDDRPDAILTGSDEIASGLIAEAKKNNLRIPMDLAVVGFDNQPSASLLEPQLTTVHQPTLEMGKAAMLQMLADLKSDSRSNGTQLLDAPLLIRKST
ncbi:DNA-binding LacI/PurR family transcriptional regulator [Alkalihalobacillus xiaoxiensis]|uniref:DNA-binding LacI/PurR family transcriptional regulator n=1 Tax=Shouchella xiaoxiensis TaxID=766895 RepID=A0ABS2SS41_9BACI|nr:LacI family DNA-binding transcriptional regulator [Shouchella xiaoxiensis]MBM7838006.1 DNA-binding LacI/PurR family transcriptional regulator [Shouchella xiaoxiensis]